MTVPDINLSRRDLISAIGGLASASFLATASCGAAPAADTASLPSFRKPDDPDDTAALMRALATGLPVHAPAGGGSGRGGVYLVGSEADANLPSGAALFGDGQGKTVIVRSTVTQRPFILHCDSKSADPARNIARLRFRDLTFADDVVRLGFSEFSYLVMLNGVSDVRFDRVEFRGFRGDGLHLGSSVTSQTERHNRKIIVSDCTFNGINSNNRNAITVIDVDDLLIERSQFRNVTRKGDGTPTVGNPMDPATGLGQPGAIDLEPNGDPFTIIRNVVIRENRFVGGGGSAVAMLLTPNDVVRVATQTILIEQNIICDRASAFQAFGYNGDGALKGRPYDLTIRNNRVDRCDKPFIISGIGGVEVQDNQFRDCAGHAELGYRGVNVDIALTGNLFERVGIGSPGYALWLRDAQGLRIEGNDFVDAGPAGGRSGIAIAVIEGVIRELAMAGNRFSSPQGRMAQTIAVFKDARVDQTTLRLGTNQTIGIPLRQALAPI